MMTDHDELASGRMRQTRWTAGYLWALGALWLPVLLYLLLTWIVMARANDRPCEPGLFTGCRLEPDEWALVWGAGLAALCGAAGALVALVFALDWALRCHQRRRYRRR